MTLKELIFEIKGDLDPKNIGLKSFIKSYLVNASFRLLYNHRLTKFFSSSNFKILRIYSLCLLKKQLHKRCCQLSPKAVLGRNLKFPHPIGIVIGDGVIIKNNVKVWQQVTIGSHGKNDQNLEYPLIENNVKIFAGAKIFGGIIVGENAVIGANAVVLKDVPANCIAVGIPAKIILK